MYALPDNAVSIFESHLKDTRLDLKQNLAMRGISKLLGDVVLFPFLVNKAKSRKQKSHMNAF